MTHQGVASARLRTLMSATASWTGRCCLCAGGMDNIVLGTLRKYSTGFVGCLSNVTLAADYAIDLTGDADDGRNIRQCSRAPAGLRRRRQRRHLDT